MDAYEARLRLATSLEQRYHVMGVVVDDALMMEFGKDFVVIKGTYVSPVTGERVENFELCFERTASIVTYAQMAIEVFKALVPNAGKIADLTVENLLDY